MSTSSSLIVRTLLFLLFGLVSIESKQSHKYLSIIKMVLVVALCAGQVYFVTLFFTTGQKQRVRKQ